MISKRISFQAFFLAGAFMACTAMGADDVLKSGPFINIWLVAGTFDNDEKNTGYDRDWIDETHVEPREGSPADGKAWRYFDDRLFSRNYDDYQDLFSYFRAKRGESIAAKVAYAHVYVHCSDAQTAQLRVGADNEFKAWLNGQLVASSLESTPNRDTVKATVELRAGWNRLLLKIANQQAGRFGFYARLCQSDGARLPGLTFSVNPGGTNVGISTKAMTDAGTGDAPPAFREWPYVGANVSRVGAIANNVLDFLRKPEVMLQASDFTLCAEGGAPPYRWALAGGRLPEGLRIDSDGRVSGVLAASARLGDHKFKVEVTDQTGKSAKVQLSITVKERPNKWYEEARLTALIHTPECLPDGSYAKFVNVMKRQGYQVGMPISYNNGRGKYRWPSIYHADNPMGDIDYDRQCLPP